MKLVTSTGDFAEFCNNYLERIQYVHEAGFRYMDLSLYSDRENQELIDNDNWMENVYKIQEYAQKHEIDFIQAHGPSANALAGEAAFAEAVRKTIRAIEVCGILRIPNVVVHAGFNERFGKKEWFERNRNFYRELFPTMEKYGVNVLHENTPKLALSCYYPTTGEDMKSFAKYVNHPLFHACWDTGHANIGGAQYQEIMDIGEELYAVHINDNRGKDDEHLLPFMGTLNMDEIMHALKDVGFVGPFTLEAGSVFRPKNYWLGDRRTYATDIRLSEPPLKLQRELEKLMYQTGKYILEAYGEFEE